MKLGTSTVSKIYRGASEVSRIYRGSSLVYEAAGGSVGDSDANAFFTATGITNPTVQSAISQMVADYKASGLWAKRYVILPMVGGTAFTHKFNLKNPNQHNLTFSGAWTHTANGAQPTNAYADMNFNPSTDAVDFNINHSLGFYSRTADNAAMGSGWVMGVGNTATGNPLFGLIARRESATSDACGFDSGNAATGLARTSWQDGSGWLFGNTTANNSRKFYKNTTLQASNSNVDTAAAPNANFYLGAMNPSPAGNFYYQNQQCAGAVIGAGVTDAEQAIERAIWQTFNTTLSRQIN